MAVNKEYITRLDEKGSINIAEEVIGVIAAQSVAEVDGIAGLSNNIGKDIAEFLGKKNVFKGVKVNVEEENIQVEVFVTIKYGFSVKEVAEAVQEAVFNAVEAMTGLKVSAVDVNVCGIAFEKEK